MPTNSALANKVLKAGPKGLYFCFSTNPEGEKKRRSFFFTQHDGDGHHDLLDHVCDSWEVVGEEVHILRAGERFAFGWDGVEYAIPG